VGNFVAFSLCLDRVASEASRALTTEISEDHARIANLEKVEAYSLMGDQAMDRVRAVDQFLLMPATLVVLEEPGLHYKWMQIEKDLEVVAETQDVE